MRRAAACAETLHAAVREPSGESATPAPAVDLAHLLRSLGGRQALAAKLAGAFRAEYRRQLSELRQELTAGLFPSAALLAHRLKGNLSILRALAAADAAASLESHLTSGDSSAAVRALSLLEAEIDEVSRALAVLLPE